MSLVSRRGEEAAGAGRTAGAMEGVTVVVGATVVTGRAAAATWGTGGRPTNLIS